MSNFTAEEIVTMVRQMDAMRRERDDYEGTLRRIAAADERDTVVGLQTAARVTLHRHMMEDSNA